MYVFTLLTFAISVTKSVTPTLQILTKVFVISVKCNFCGDFRADIAEDSSEKNCKCKRTQTVTKE